MSLQRNIGIFAIVFCMLVGSTWTTVKFTCDHLLYQNATSTAQHWAQFLVESVGDLEQIAAGEQPSNASMAFFSATKKSHDVFRFEIFNRDGYSQLVSDHGKIALVDLSEYSADAARSIATGRAVVSVKEGQSPDLPLFFARAYVPVVVDQRPIAIVAAYVDQTENRDNFYSTVLIGA